MKTQLKPNRLTIAVGMAVAVAGYLPVAGMALEGDIAKKSAMLEEIVVTATKRSESLQDVPISITALTAADIEVTGAQQLQDLANSVPNLIYPSARQPGQADIAMRGIYTRVETHAIGLDPGFGVYLDGVYLGKNYASNADLGEIERVEVLRGPQGTLFGKNTISGAINIVSKKPGNEFEGKVVAEVGNYDRRQVRGSVNIPLVEDVLATRLSFNTTRRDGYVTNLFNNDDDIGNIDKYAGRFQLGYTPSDATVIYLNIDVGKSESKVYALENLPDPDNSFNDSSVDNKRFTISLEGSPNSTVETKGVSLSVEHELSNGYTLTSITGAREDETSNKYNVEFRPIDGFTSDNASQQTMWTQELRVASPVSDRYDFVAGLYYLKQDNKFDAASHVGQDWLPTLVGTLYSSGAVDVTSYAAFVHGNFHLTEALTLFGGVRYTEETKELSRFQSSDPAAILAAFKWFVGEVPVPVDVEDKDPSWTVGLRYALSNEVQTYASVSRGVESGALNQAQKPADLHDNLIVDPEYVTNYEVGVKSTMLDGRLRLNAALFYMDYEDLQVTFWDPNGGLLGTGATLWRNAAAMTSKGLELELAYRPTDNLSVNAGIGYTDATFDKYSGVTDPRTGERVDASGNRAQMAPEWTVNASVQHELPLANGGTWLTRLDYNFVDERYSDRGATNSPDDLVPSHSLLNARLGYTSAGDNWGVYLWAKNLLDKEYVEERRFFSFIGARMTERYGEPRTYGLSATYRF